LIPQPYLPNY